MRFRWAGLAAALLGVALVGGYLVLDRIAQDRAEAGVAAFSQSLPRDASLSYATLSASPLTQSATLEAVVLQVGSSRMRADEIVVGGVRERASGTVEVGHVKARGVTGRHRNRTRVDTGTVELEDLVVDAERGTVQALGAGRTDSLVVSRGPTEVVVSNLALDDWAGQRVARLSAEEITLRGLSRTGQDRETFRDVALEELSLGPLAALDGDALNARAVLRAASQIRYEALAIGEAEIREDGDRRLALTGLDARQKTTEAGGIAWRTQVERFSVQPERVDPRLGHLLDAEGLLRGQFTGRQVFDPKARTLDLESLRVTVARGGTLTGTLRLVDVAPSSAETAAFPAPEQLSRAKLDRVEAEFVDDGLVGTLLDRAAAATGMARADLARRYLQGLRAQLRDAPDRVQASLDALESFLREGGTLALRLDPPEAVSINAAIVAFSVRPGRAAARLNLSVSHR